MAKVRGKSIVWKMKRAMYCYMARVFSLSVPFFGAGIFVLDPQKLSGGRRDALSCAELYARPMWS